MFNPLVLLTIIPLFGMLFVGADYYQYEAFAQYSKSSQDSSEDNVISDVEEETVETASEIKEDTNEITSDMKESTQELASEPENPVDETIDDVETVADERPKVNVNVGDNAESGGCLIATAAYGTELAPQVQFLREIRDNTVMSTTSGAAFMTGFNQLYYLFSPTVADLERKNPMFQETVRAFITPMVSTLSIMTLADDGSEEEVLGLGLSVIALNLGMYIAVPALIGFKVYRCLRNN